jgi:hypothetical protein
LLLCPDDTIVLADPAKDRGDAKGEGHRDATEARHPPIS